MNILIMDTDRQSARELAEWFTTRGDSAYIVSRRTSDWSGAHGIGVNLLDEAAVVKAVNEIKGGIDVLVLGAENICPDGVIGANHDENAMLHAVLYNLKGSLNLIDACLPHMEHGLRRIACVTTRESSNSWSCQADNLSWHQSLSGMNMMGKLLFNRLRPQGYTFRWYCEGAPRGMCAGEYIMSQLCFDPKEPYIHSDENRLTLRDGLLREIPW